MLICVSAERSQNECQSLKAYLERAHFLLECWLLEPRGSRRRFRALTMRTSLLSQLGSRRLLNPFQAQERHRERATATRHNRCELGFASHTQLTYLRSRTKPNPHPHPSQLPTHPKSLHRPLWLIHQSAVLVLPSALRSIRWHGAVVTHDRPRSARQKPRRRIVGEVWRIRCTSSATWLTGVMRVRMDSLKGSQRSSRVRRGLNLPTGWRNMW